MTLRSLNRLSQSASLYLRKHAENPIDWWPWCSEALAKAVTEDKPIFLSIGYSSCHWCTVMEGEAFSDGAIATYLNQHFVAIKVDREENPDLDSIYMQFLQMMVGQGGWPLNVFLSPSDRVPFYGGTYFPLDPRYGRPGFLQVLQSLRRYYDTDRSRLVEIQQEMLKGLHQSIALGNPQAWNADLLKTGLDQAAEILAPRFGGNRFPMMPHALAVLQRSRWAEKGGEVAIESVEQRGFDLVLGGIYDQVAGGFHRYTVDATWTVPHFEKMLYDNGQILEFMSLLWARGCQMPALARSVKGTIAWLAREMTAPEGYFYAAQDADSFATIEAAEPEEGAFYAWSYDRLQELLTESEFTALIQEFTVTKTGNFEGQNVLQRRSSIELSEDSIAALASLFRERYGQSEAKVTTFPPARTNGEAKTFPWPGRIPAVTDTKMIVAWNALMISGLAVAARVFGNFHAYQLAARAAQFILHHQWQPSKDINPTPDPDSRTDSPDEPRFYRLNYDGQVAVPAQSEDYACWIKALLDLHQAQVFLQVRETEKPQEMATPATPMDINTDWLTPAIVAQQAFDRWLGDDSGGYYNSPIDASETLVVRERSYADHATPSANGLAVANLVRLSLLTENLTYLHRAEQTLKTFAPVMERSPQACPSLFAGLDWFEHSAIVKFSPLKLSQSSLLHFQSEYWPTIVFQPSSELPETIVGMVCSGLNCQAPATSEAELREQLRITP